MADIFEIAGRIHSTSREHVISPADEILDTSQNKKQHLINSDVARHESEINSPTNGLNKRVADIEALGQIGDTPVETNASNIINNTSLNGKVPSASAVNGIYNALISNTGYYECNSEGSTAAKGVNAPGYVLTVGGCIKIKMTNSNSVDNATLNINSTGDRALYYEGERASSTNTWDDNEIIEVYYDGTYYYANNVAGGSSSGVFDVSKKFPTSGVEGGDTYTLELALSVLNANLSANKKEGGMEIKFVSSSDHKYVQYFLTKNEWSATTSDWEQYDAAGVSKQPATDLDISDESNNVLARFKKGHIKTKNFDSSKDATEKERGLMSSTDKTKLNTIEHGAEVNDVDTNNTGLSDFDITDENDYVLARFRDGHFKTKNFDSRNLQLGESGKSDFEITDVSGNKVVEFKNGHIKTKNFSSKDVIVDIEKLKNDKVAGRDVVFLSSVFISVPSAMDDGDVCFVIQGVGGSFMKKVSGELIIDSTLGTYYKQNADKLIFYNKMDTMYYLYQNNTMVLYCNRVPRVSFTLDDTMYDCETPESWTASGLMNIIYTKFDTLLQSAPSTSDLNVNCRLSVSKVDMVDYLNQNSDNTWSYPAYNDGDKSNMYIISNEQTYRAGYNAGMENQKHRILIIGGVHGGERVAQYNTYLFAKQLLSHYKDNQNLYNLLLTFDIYIIPVLCVYGSKNGTRWNGNGVNIERNFPAEWAYDSSVEPFTNNYMGLSAASEFETQAIMALVEKINPDVIIDHHSYYRENQNLYCYSPSLVFSNAVFKIGCTLGRLLNKNFSEYYGDGPWYPTNGATTNVTNGLKGASPLHFYETKKIMASGIMEVAEAINFSDGEYDITTGDNTHLNTDVLKIAEYTLRNCVENLAEWVLTNSN